MSVEFNQNLLNNNKGDNMSSNNASETVNTAKVTGDSVQSTQGSTESSITVENQNEAQNQVNKQREERISISALEKIRNLFTNNDKALSNETVVENTAASAVSDIDKRVIEDKPQVNQVAKQPSITEPPAAPVQPEVVEKPPIVESEPVREVVREVASADPNELFKNQDFINNLSTVILEINKSTQEINNNPVKQPQVVQETKPVNQNVNTYDVYTATGRDMYGNKVKPVK